MATRLLLLDDHPVSRAGLVAWLEGTEFCVVGEATSAAMALRLVEECSPDMLLLELRLPGSDGVSCLGTMRDAGVRAPALLFSGFDNPVFLARAMAMGAAGYVPKSAPREKLLEALRTAAAGELLWTAHDRRRLAGPVAKADPSDDLEAPLTRRERDVLSQLALGLSNKEIAQALGISHETAKEHVQNILRKVGVNDRTKAAVWAVRKELTG